MSHSSLDWFARVLVFVIVTLVGCIANQTATQVRIPKASTSESQTFTTTIVKQRDYTERIEVPVNMEGFQQADLMSRIAAYVAAVHVDIGDEVDMDQLLVTLDAPEIPAELDRRQRMVNKAQADLISQKTEVTRAVSQLAELQAMHKKRQSELNRVEKLVESGALTQEQLDEAEYSVATADASIISSEANIKSAEALVNSAVANVEVAKAEAEKADVMNRYLEIRAPFSGVVTERNVDPGASVRPGDSEPLVRLENVKSLRCVLMIPIAESAKLDVGDPVELTRIRGIPGRRIETTISRTSKSLALGSRMMRAETDIENPVNGESGKRLLKPGDYGKAVLTLAIWEGVTSIPDEALGDDGGQAHVWVVESDGTCRRMSVDVLVKENGYTAVAGGLTIGQRVVVGDIQKIKNGQKIPVES